MLASLWRWISGQLADTFLPADLFDVDLGDVD